jgi:hypoxanthine-guanine phosphoribosyltransferase
MPSERVARAQVLVVEDCPNAGLTVERLRQALDEHGATEVEVELLVVEPGTRPPDGFADSPTDLLRAPASTMAECPTA